jgi:hypothetical protein
MKHIIATILAISASNISDVVFMQNSGCIANLRKPQPHRDSNLDGSIRKKSRYSSVGKGRRWQLGPEAMENNASISISLEANISSVPNSIVNDSKMSMESGTDTSFINHGTILFSILGILSESPPLNMLVE